MISCGNKIIYWGNKIICCRNKIVCCGNKIVFPSGRYTKCSSINIQLIVLVQYKAVDGCHHHLIKCNLFSPWYSWQNANLTLNIEYVAQLGNIILIPSQPVFVLTRYSSWVVSGEAANTNYIVFGLTWLGLNPWSTSLKAGTLAITADEVLTQRTIHTYLSIF
jgi:hypothetical protein